jgi:hypothetical protein
MVRLDVGMRWIASAAVIAVSLFGAALAQEGPLAFRPTWEVEPTPAQIITHYPAQALAQNVSGIAVLCCTPRDDRSIDCAVHSEWPAGHGFGAASQRASQGYRLSQQSQGDLAARPGTQVRLAMMWAGPVVSEETRGTLIRMNRESVEACLPPA